MYCVYDVLSFKLQQKTSFSSIRQEKSVCDGEKAAVLDVDDDEIPLNADQKLKGIPSLGVYLPKRQEQLFALEKITQKKLPYCAKLLGRIT